MILSESKANPIVDLLLKNAIEKITEETGISVDIKIIEYEFFDSDWLFDVNIDEEQNYVDITAAVKTIDDIVARNIEFINYEKENN